jgi:cholesterol transport system auxiliary component
MTRPCALLRAGLAAALALSTAASLSGCISLLPKSKPAHLYTFGAPAAAQPRPETSAATVGVFWANGDFQRESAGDNILTITGDKAAYIAETRWVAPAQVLFDQAVQAAFENASGHVRLVPRGAPAPTDYSLRVDVRDFETRYDAGRGAAPTVLIRVHASLTQQHQRTLVSEQVFEASARASDNRVSAIVQAYDKALAQILSDLVGWTNQKTAAA